MKTKQLIVSSLLIISLAGLFSSCCSDCDPNCTRLEYGIINRLDSTVSLAFTGRNDSLLISLHQGDTSELWQDGFCEGDFFELLRGGRFPYNSPSFDVDSVFIMRNDSLLVVFSYLDYLDKVKKLDFDFLGISIFSDEAYSYIVLDQDTREYYYILDSLKIN